MNSNPLPFSDTPLAKRLLETSPAAVAVVDSKRTIIFVNQQLTDLLGFSSQELIGRHSDVIMPQLSQCASAVLDAHFTSQFSCNENRLPAEPTLAVNKSGMCVPVTISLHEISGSNQSWFLAYLAFAGSQPVDDGVLKAERLEAIEQMVSGLAHESRNAMQRAVACLDLLDLDLNCHPAQMLLSKKIRKSLSDIFDNYEQVRRYAQPISIKMECVNLPNLCQIAFNELAVDCDHLEFSESSTPDDLVFVDRGKLKLLFAHILENAVDAAEGIARIEIRCHRQKWHDAEAVKISVRDHGKGFDDTSLEHAFEPFYTSKQHGTGLGLAVCHRIAEAHQGQITASNHPNGGAIIEIVIPAPIAQGSPHSSAVH